MEDFLNRTVVSDIKVITETIQVDIVVLSLIIVKQCYVFPETYNYSSVWPNHSFKSVPSIFYFVYTTHDVLGSFRKLVIAPCFLKFSISSATIVNSNLTISVTFPVGNTVGNHKEDCLTLVGHATFVSIVLLDSIFDGRNCWSSPCYTDVVDKAVDSVLICRQTRRFVLIIVLRTPTTIYIWFTCKGIVVVIIVSIYTLEASNHDTV